MQIPGPGLQGRLVVWPGLANEVRGRCELPAVVVQNGEVQERGRQRVLILGNGGQLLRQLLVEGQGDGVELLRLRVVLLLDQQEGQVVVDPGQLQTVRGALREVVRQA